MAQLQPKISVLIAARPNSKYLAKFLVSMLNRTNQHRLNCEYLVMLNVHDEWNKDFVEFFEKYVKTIEMIVGVPAPLKFFYENKQLGRAGLHEYFNDLAKEARGEWLVYFCEDHYIRVPDWDEILIQRIEERDLNSEQIHVIVPKFDNAGAMNHIVSRGYYETLNHVGQNGWIDSYINDLAGQIPADRVHKIDDELFHDFTHDKPEPMDPVHYKQTLAARVKDLPKKGSPEYDEQVKTDAEKINHQIERGRR